jgi:tetratricopeptide (TPR) repeat protein
MSEDIRVMTAQLAADPTSLVFLPLGEALRQRKRLDAARKVVLAGLARYPELADAHDLYGRILGDHGNFEQAFDEWGIAIRLDPDHAGAHKGIGFLYFVAGKLDQALGHLQAAQKVLPEDEGVAAAMARVREALQLDDSDAGTPSSTGPVPPEEEADDITEQVFAGLEGAENGLLLVDQHGQRLGGGLRSPAGQDVADRVAAHLAGVSREATRAARLLEMGDWDTLTVQSDNGNMHLASPTADTVLLVVRDSAIPLGRLAALSARAGSAARSWLESLT